MDLIMDAIPDAMNTLLDIPTRERAAEVSHFD